MISRKCRICLSPYRKEIIGAYKQGIPTPRIYEKYAPLMNYTAQVDSLYQMILRHTREGHVEDAILVTSPEGSSNKVGPATIETFSKKMLELGMAKINDMDPSKVALKDVIAAQKLELDSKKLKLSENAFELMMGKMFAPPELNTIEGEYASNS